VNVSEYLTVAEAREMLQVTKRRIAEMIEDGTLPAEPNPFDRRSKLIKRSDVVELLRKRPAKKLLPEAA
jgi:excisionase family DNA binding protein